MTGQDAFESITSGIAHDSPWYAAVQEARAAAHRANPQGVDTVEIGHAAWRQLTPVQQAKALDGLFAAYIRQLYDEEHAAHLDAVAADETRSYLQPDDEYLLQVAVAGIESTDEETTVDGVNVEALRNVLAELDLLRWRLTSRSSTGSEGEQ
ncbi:hypothetical protein H8N00_03750 [Streptomyces sp. AC563]|uniref:hypothetical protein n=1 Tax=Streptomyces buecherae TaxID=2763006 RepID=UPI00164CEA28|nr:hypothetical protein [Streptomyces buecherae]MBC3988027.1 hypothetical protein [Streptomyces buecherae]